MDWIQRNFKTLIYISFLVPILTVAFVSISHVTTWYGLTNPVSWAIYLSVGIEIAALSALAAISAQMGKKVYFPFGIVTLIQFIGNIFFAYQYIDLNSEMFKDWVDLVDPIVSYIGVESGNMIAHKRFLSLFSGGMLPLISLSFLHMLVKFEEEEKNKQKLNIQDVNIDELSKEAGKIEASVVEQKYNPTEEELKRIEEELIKINEQKFGILEEPNSDDENVSQGVQLEEIITEVPTEIQPQNDEELIIEVITKETEDKTDSDSTIQVEPDFYREEEADYDIDGDTVKPKRLVYTKNS
jgi:hypothetical protein